MAKFYGKIGYVMTSETKPGVWTQTITERDYYGNVTRLSRKTSSGDKVNEEFNISQEVSIIADPFANDNLSSIRYVEFMGAKWKVNTIQVAYPRLILEIGGLYNNDT